jgi:hypothetical protein
MYFFEAVRNARKCSEIFRATLMQLQPPLGMAEIAETLISSA